MKAIEQYFHVVLFIMLYRAALTFTSVDETVLSSVTTHMKAIEHCVCLALLSYLAVQGDSTLYI